MTNLLTKLTLPILVASVLIAPLAHRPVFLPLIAASCQSSLLHEQAFEIEYETTRFIVRQNPCSDQLQTRHFEISDTQPDGMYTSWTFVHTDFSVDRTVTWGDGHWRTVQRVEFRDFNFPFTVHAYQQGE